MSSKKIHPLTVVIKVNISYIDKPLLVAVIFFYFIFLGILTWGVYRIMNCTLSHFCVEFNREIGRLTLG